jgi:hypothetical protein
MYYVIYIRYITIIIFTIIFIHVNIFIKIILEFVLVSLEVDVL